MIPITTQARKHASHRLLTVEAHGATRVRHTIDVPRAACPVSGNPISGTATIVYRPAGRALEVVSLHGAMAWATGRNDGAPRSVEELVAWLATEATAVLGVAVAVRLDLTVQPGPQRIVVDHAVLSRNA